MLGARCSVEGGKFQFIGHGQVSRQLEHIDGQGHQAAVPRLDGARRIRIARRLFARCEAAGIMPVEPHDAAPMVFKGRAVAGVAGDQYSSNKPWRSCKLSQRGRGV